MGAAAEISHGSGGIHRYLSGDHKRLDALLERAASDPEHIDATAYARFRSGLLRHIAIEEKFLLPAARKARGGEPLPPAAKLRLDHGALTALLVPSPTGPIIAAIRAISTVHNPVEENPGGVYDECEALLGLDADRLSHQIENFREVKMLPHVNTPFVIEATRRALARAGYAMKI